MTVRRTRLSTEHEDLGPVRLYREDLRAIATAVSELGDMTITCDGEYEASEPTDFDHLPERLANLEISSRKKDIKRSITVKFDSTSASIDLVEPDTHSLGVAARVKEICDQKLRLRRLLFRNLGYNFVSAGIISIILYTVLYIGVNGTKSAKPPWSGIWLNEIVPLLLLSFIPIGLGLRFFGTSRVIIINALRADRPGYWKRTGDTWIVGVITAVLGALIGYFLGQIT